LRLLYLPESANYDKEIPLELSTVHSGSMTISASELILPEGIDITFTDLKTGDSFPLDESFAYNFTHESEAKGREETTGALQLPSGVSGPSAGKSDDPARFMLTVSQTSTSASPDDQLPQEFALSQNYPNPFNPTTQITYDLPEASNVRLEVYNVMGQRVATLVNSQQNAGIQTVTFNATNLASGMYIYRLRAGSFVQTRQMMLVK